MHWSFHSVLLCPNISASVWLVISLPVVEPWITTYPRVHLQLADLIWGSLSESERCLLSLSRSLIVIITFCPADLALCFLSRCIIRTRPSHLQLQDQHLIAGGGECSAVGRSVLWPVQRYRLLIHLLSWNWYPVAPDTDVDRRLHVFY